MKPSDIHALPTIEVQELVLNYHESSIVEKVFGLSQFGQIDFDGAYHAQGDKITMNVKAQHYDYRHTASVMSIMFGDDPFGIYLEAGHEGQSSQFFVTDQSVMAKADAWLRSWIHASDVVRNDATDDRDMPELTSFHGHVLTELHGKPRLLQDFMVDGNGRAIADPDAYRLKMREANTEILEIGEDATLRDERVRAIAHKAFLDARMPDLEYAEVCDFDDAKTPNFISYVIATDEGTYKVGVAGGEVDSKQRSWTREIAVGRIGGPEEIEKYRSGFDLYGGPGR